MKRGLKLGACQCRIYKRAISVGDCAEQKTAARTEYGRTGNGTTCSEGAKTAVPCSAQYARPVEKTRPGGLVRIRAGIKENLPCSAVRNDLNAGAPIVLANRSLRNLLKGSYQQFEAAYFPDTTSVTFY